VLQLFAISEYRFTVHCRCRLSLLLKRSVVAHQCSLSTGSRKFPRHILHKRPASLFPLAASCCSVTCHRLSCVSLTSRTLHVCTQLHAGVCTSTLAALSWQLRSRSTARSGLATSQPVHCPLWVGNFAVGPLPAQPANRTARHAADRACLLL
jgi:hypothetical protein